MKAKYTLQAVASAATLAIPISAHATVVNFSFTGESGGTVTGYLDFASDTGQQVPTSWAVTGLPGFFSVAPPITFGAEHYGHFTLSNGNIVGASHGFTATTNNVDGHFRLAFDHGGTPAGSNFLSHGSKYTINYGGFAGATFTIPGAVPEPASLALVGAGLAGIAAFRRRRARA